jgi:hypothetical protein
MESNEGKIKLAFSILPLAIRKKQQSPSRLKYQKTAQPLQAAGRFLNKIKDNSEILLSFTYSSFI